jgi:hypothetical protein
VKVELTFSNAAETARTLDCRLEIRGPQGNVVYRTEKQTAVEIPARGEKKTAFSIKLNKNETRLWHFNHPHLYTSVVELLDKGQPIHQLTDRFGIRKIEVDGYHFKLNGETVRTVGFNLVPEERSTGNTLPLWRIKEDVDLMKQLGANMARISHLSLPREFLDYLDERGIMTFEEVSLWGKDAMVDPDHPTPKEWLERMVQYKYNHPSIIGWTVGNEIGRLHANPKVMEYVKEATAHAKSLDPLRLAVYVTHSAHSQSKDPVEFSDMILNNSYGNWGKNADKVNSLHPGKPIFMAEYGDKLNDENPEESFIDAKAILDTMRGREFLMGASLWTFNDYRSFWKSDSPGWSTDPSQNRAWGVVTSLREKKKPYFAFRREYAPVKSLAFEANGGGSSGNVTLTPRGKLDLPAYPMRGYRLLWATFDDAGKVTSGGFTELPEILPGDAAKNFPVEWSATGATRLEIHLLDPLDYSVLDTVIHFTTPTAPKILSVHTARKKARVVFEPVKNATGYALRYRKSDGEWQQTAPTINHFLEAEELDGFTRYEFSVVALNGAGRGAASETVIAATDEDELPPIIWKTIPADGSFFVGYSVGLRDYLYEVALGETPGQYTRTLILRNVGVLKIPNLKNGKTYYYKMRLRKQWGFASEWTHEIAVTPDGGKPQHQPTVSGTLTKADKSILLFEPVEKAFGYELELDDGKTITIPTAQSRFFSFEGGGLKNGINGKPGLKPVTKKQPYFAPF